MQKIPQFVPHLSYITALTRNKLKNVARWAFNSDCNSEKNIQIGPQMQNV